MRRLKSRMTSRLMAAHVAAPPGVAHSPRSGYSRAAGGWRIGPRPWPADPTNREGPPPMATERTLSIIKPDATRRNLSGRINAKLEEAGLRIIAQKRLLLSRAQAEAFYAVHRERPFFAGLVEFMTSGPVVVQVLEGENAVARNREVMGATDPAKAAEGTIRKQFAENIEANSVHGSDSAENAKQEIAFFFKEDEIVG